MELNNHLYQTNYQTPPPVMPNRSKRRWWVEVLKFLGIFLVFFIVLTAVVMGPTFYTQIAYYFTAPTQNYSDKYNLPVAARDEFSGIQDLADLFEEQAQVPFTTNNTIIIPKINVDAPIIDIQGKDNQQVLEDIKRGVGRYPGTAKPGRAGNVFLTGHSSYYWWNGGKYNQVFSLLHQLDVGDLIYIYYEGDRFIYKVNNSSVVHPSETGVLNQPLNQAMLTLMTCTPIGTNLRRLIVTAELVGQPPMDMSDLETVYEIPDLPIILPLY
ncbi:hypothetical protein DRH29_00400 [candidate division Kazan bacterium]|uniref:Sortase n=1 Tax=candidate division Kazan bacterium TaxID=2202143 RepID=A0A420ZDT8_UNCK3|nr:MAG: hypothetical protein DRH29_00400 [candidate division Kazan bacterium]